MATPDATWAMEMSGSPNECMLLHLLQRVTSAWSLLWFLHKAAPTMMPPNSQLLYVVVGEGDHLALKAARVARLLDKPCAMYVQTPDTSLFEPVSISKDGGTAVDDRRSLARCGAPGVLFVSMAPVGLLAEYAANPPAFLWKYAHTRLVCYGGDTFCRVMSSGGGVRLITMMHAFKAVYIYDNAHAMCADMVLDDATTIDRVRAVPDMALFMDHYSSHNMARARARCVEIDPSFPEVLPPDHPGAVAYTRHRKAYDQLEATAGRHIVLESMALALTSPEDYSPVQVSLRSNGDTTVLVDPTSKFHIIQRLEYTEVVRRLGAALA